MPSLVTQRGTYTGAGVVATHNITNPGGFANGDVLVLVLSVSGGSSTALTPPAGWTLRLRIDNGTDVSLFVYTKTAASEGAQWQFSANPAAEIAGDILSIAGGDPQAPFVLLNGQVNVSGTDAPFPDYATGSFADVALLFTAAVGNITFTSPTGYTELADVADATAPAPMACHVSRKVHGYPTSVSGLSDTLSGANLSVTASALVWTDQGVVRQLIETVVPVNARIETVIA